MIYTILWWKAVPRFSRNFGKKRRLRDNDKELVKYANTYMFIVKMFTVLVCLSRHTWLCELRRIETYFVTDARLNDIYPRTIITNLNLLSGSLLLTMLASRNSCFCGRHLSIVSFPFATQLMFQNINYSFFFYFKILIFLRDRYIL